MTVSLLMVFPRVEWKPFLLVFILLPFHRKSSRSHTRCYTYVKPKQAGGEGVELVRGREQQWPVKGFVRQVVCLMVREEVIFSELFPELLPEVD